MSLATYRHTAAHVAAAAVFESFPDVELLGAKETSLGFSYDLVFPHPIHNETLAMIEQAMRQISREKREITVLEMVPFSAKELLKAEGHLARAESLEESKELVQIIKMGSFYDLCSGEQLKNSNQLTFFKLHNFISLDNGVKRLTGFAYPTKEELNEFLKRLKQHPERRHERVGELQGLWRVKGKKIIWFQKGLQIRNRLVQFFERHLFQGMEQIQAYPDCDRMALSQELGRPVIEMTPSSIHIVDPDAGLYGNKGSQIRIYSLETNSLLQLIEKSLTILGLEHKENFCLEDVLGRKWPVVEIEKEFWAKKSSAVVTLSIEKILALLLEKYERLERLSIENQ